MQDSGRLASILPLTENIKLCRIATRIQDLMATGPVVRGEERCSIDGQLVSWYTNLPWLLRTMEPCAESLYMARCMLKWRYQSLRLLLHRPILLAVASHSTTSDAKPSDQDLASVEKCRDMAEATISDISREWTQNQMAAWTAVLYLYQAVMIPLVSIFWERHSPQVPRWQRQVEVVLDLLAAMDEWSLAASRSREVVWRMYEASHHALTLGGPEQSTTGQHGIILGDADVGLSPTGLEAGDMVGLFEDSIFLGVDGVPYWGQGQGSLPTADTMCDIGGQGIMPMGYATTGHPEPSIGPPFFVQ